MAITNRKIAKLAGVSPSTVSKVFSSSPEISAETAERVRKIAQENGWTPPKYRKTTAHPDKHHVAILIPELISASYGHSATIAVSALREHGIEPQIHLTGFRPQDMEKVVDDLLGDGWVDGILLINSFLYKKPCTIPIIGIQTLLRQNEPCPYDIVFSYTEDFCIRYITDYLIGLGHTNIVFISENNTTLKLKSYQSSMAEHGFSAAGTNFFVSDKRFEEIGYDAVSYYVDYARRNPSFVFPTAFVCAYDEVAFGATRALQNIGLRVPEDVSVVGINDVPLAANASVPLTTVRTFSDAQMQLAVQLLLKKIEHPEITMKQKVEIPCELVIRKSTAPPRTSDDLPVLYESRRSIR